MADDDDDDVVVRGRRLAIGLEHQRFKHLSWMGFGIVAGIILIWKLGTVAQWVGVGLILAGGVAGYAFVRTLLFPAGTIVVDDAGVELPRGLCRGEPAKFALADVAHAYLLRRAVPWTRAAPVLVIEAGGTAYTYPRDWFLTEADQRRVVRELHTRGSGRGCATPVEAAYAGPKWWAVDPVDLYRGDGLGPVLSGKAGKLQLHQGGVSDDGREVRFADADLLGSAYTEYQADRHTRLKVLAFEYAWQRQGDGKVEQMVMRDQVPKSATHNGGKVEALRLRHGDTEIRNIPDALHQRVKVGVFVHRFPAIEAAYRRGETVTFGPVACSKERLTAEDVALEWKSIRTIRLTGGIVHAVGTGKPAKLGHWGDIPNVAMLMTLLNVVVGLEVESDTGVVAEPERLGSPSAVDAQAPA